MATPIVVAFLGALRIYFDDQQLASWLAAQPTDVAVAFSASCAARLVNTAAYFRIHGDLTILLSSVIDNITDYLSGESELDIAIFEDKLLSTMPEEDAEPDLISAVAEDAAAATVYTLRLLRDGNSQNAIWAAQRAYETADRGALLRIGALQIDRSDEKSILNHPVVQMELQRQSRDQNSLSGIIDGSDKLVSVVLRSRGENILFA